MQGTSNPVAPERTSPGSNGVGRRLAEATGMAAIAVTQPLLDLLGRNADIFITHRSTAAQGVGIIALAVLAVPLIGLLVEGAAGRVRPSWAGRVHTGVIGALAGVLVLAALSNHTALPVPFVLVAAVAILPVTAFGLMRQSWFRQALRFLALSPIAFVFLFAFASPGGDALFDRGAATTGTAVPIDRRVVVIMFDELPLGSLLDGEGRVDAELFPEFAAFANESTWYRNTTTAAAFTQYAVPAILTGRMPDDESAPPLSSEYADNLFTALNGAVEMNVHETATRICADAICGSGGGGSFGDLAASSLRLFADFVSPSREREQFDENAAARVRVPTADDFTESLVALAADRGRLDLVHLEFPHWPWQYLATMQDTRATGELPGESYLLWPSAIGAEIGRQRHLLQLQATDTLLGRMLDRVRALPDYDDAVIVVTADHGASFRTGEPVRNPSVANLDDIAWVPLFVKYPNQTESEVDDQPAITIDIVPTILDVLDVDSEAAGTGLDGESLLDPLDPRRARALTTWVTFPTIRDLEPDADGRVAVDPSGFDRVLTRQAAPAGGDPALRIYRHSAYGALIGEPVSELQVGTPSAARVRLEAAEHFATIDPGASTLPWAVNVGRVSGTGADQPLAVAVNGRIAALTATLPATDGDEVGFVFLVPPALVHAGANDIEVYELRGLGAGTTLHPTERSD